MESRSSFPDVLVIDPLDTHTRTFILLHGRGSSGREFAEELLESRSSADLSIREELPGYKWVFPTALARYSTIFHEDMTEWFDISSLTDPKLQSSLQIDGLSTSIGYLTGLIREEAARTESGQVILGGISQGCAVGLMTLLGGSAQPRAFVGLCGWLPFRSLLAKIAGKSINEKGDTNDLQPLLRDFFSTTFGVERSDVESPLHHVHSQIFRIPILLSHAYDDDAVGVELGRSCRRTLEALGLDVQWNESPDGGHWIQEPEGIDDLLSFLKGLAS